MIKTIIFDLNKVLVTHDYSDKLYMNSFGITRESFWKDRKEDLHKYEMSEITLADLLSCQLKKNALSKDQLGTALEVYKKGLRLVKGMLEILENLSKKYDLILLAGEGKEGLIIKLNSFNLEKYFKKIYSTCFLKMTKSDKKVYEYVLKDNKLNPEEVLFIDDRTLYLQAANFAGIKGVQFENSEKLAKELNSRGIL